jgi:uncharacterized protein
MVKYVKSLSLALLLSAGIGGVTKAASFDCNKATTETEIAICNDPELSALDERLSGVYVRGRQVTKNVSGSNLEIQNNQIDWLNKRNQCGSETSCLLLAYQTRLEELKEFDFEDLLSLAKQKKQMCKDQAELGFASGITQKMLDAGNKYNLCLESIIANLITATTSIDRQSIDNHLEDLSNSYQRIISGVFASRVECSPHCGSMYQLYPSAMYSNVLEELITNIDDAQRE